MFFASFSKRFQDSLFEDFFLFKKICAIPILAIFFVADKEFTFIPADFITDNNDIIVLETQNQENSKIKSNKCRRQKENSDIRWKFQLIFTVQKRDESEIFTGMPV